MGALLYILGLLVVLGALAYGAMLLGVPVIWIAVGVALLAGLGIMAAASHTRRSTVVESRGAPAATREVHYHQT